MKQCKNVCKADPECRAFHFYLLDPKGYTNCWIWTKDGYSGNGSEKAFCFVKNDEAKNNSESDVELD